MELSHVTSYLGHHHQLTHFPSCLHLALHLCFLHPSLHLTIHHSLPCHIPVPSAIVGHPSLLKPFQFQSDNIPRSSFSCLQLRHQQPQAFISSLMFPSPSIHHSFFLSLPPCPPDTAHLLSWLINIVPLCYDHALLVTGYDVLLSTLQGNLSFSTSSVSSFASTHAGPDYLSLLDPLPRHHASSDSCLEPPSRTLPHGQPRSLDISTLFPLTSS